MYSQYMGKFSDFDILGYRADLAPRVAGALNMEAVRG
jgi:hypothetical protein